MCLIVKWCLEQGTFTVDEDDNMLNIIFFYRPGFEWSHEQASEMMLEYLVDDNNIDIERDHLNLIKDLIAGAPRSQRYW